MSYRSLRECVNDLERHGRLVRIKEEVDPDLEMAAVHRRVFQAGGPAVFYERVKGSPFPAVSNLFGTLERARFLFRDTLRSVQQLARAKADPVAALKKPLEWPSMALALRRSVPRESFSAPVRACSTTLDQLPQIRCWPGDGGAFILLPQVYSEDPERPGIARSNLGMYRIQLSGNEYETNKTVGLHYQIRRDIGIHHAKALERGEPLRVSIFVGGPPAHSFAAVMYLPENISETRFAGALAGRPFRYQRKNGFVLSSDADFCITGYVDPGKALPEGPFGDHLGYYSLRHPFPVMRVESVFHRRGAIWPFTVVGRPPQEDSVLGRLVQEIAAPVIPSEIPGVRAIHAVDECGVHPLLLAVGSERFAPTEEREPRELLKEANALLGYGPCALAKYLLIAAGEDDPVPDVKDVRAFFRHMLERVDWRRDLHFQTRTTIDTLDYTGGALNRGSKLVIAAAGKKKRELAASMPEMPRFPEGFAKPRIAMPGILVVQGEAFSGYPAEEVKIRLLAKAAEERGDWSGLPLWVIADESDFVSKDLANFLWVTFTRSDPSQDVYGVRSFESFKHWGCEGPLLIDARAKPHHAPVLEADSQIEKRVDALAARGRSLCGVI